MSNSNTIFRILKANGRERRYWISTISILSDLPTNATIGDLAILSSNGKFNAYFYNSKRIWEPDTGHRTMQRKRLVHFPDPEWKRWILHGEGDSVHWEYDDTARENMKDHISKQSESNPVLSLSPTTVTPTTSSQSLFGLTTSFNPSPTVVSNSNATNILSNIVNRFREVFVDSPDTYEKCAGPLIRLLEKGNTDEIPIIACGNTEKDGLTPECRITMVSLFDDLMKNEKVKIQDPFRDSGLKTVSELITAMTTNSKGIFGKLVPVVLGAANLPPHRNGSGSINILPPIHLRDSSVCSHLSNGLRDNVSFLTSTGYITEPHWDDYGIPQFIIHAGGKKLWLIWPATPENLQTAAKTFYSVEKTIDFTIARALEELNGLQICYPTEQDEWFIVPSCAVHAVITVESSGHKTKLFLDYTYFDTWDQGYSLITKALVSQYNGSHTSSERRRILGEIVESCKAFNHWESLLNAKPNHNSASRTQNRLNEIKKETELVLESLGYTPKRSPPPHDVQSRKRSKRNQI